MVDDVLSKAFTADEVVAAVCKLQYWSFTGLYDEVHVYHAELNAWYVYDTQPGPVLGDLCKLVNSASAASAVPEGWGNTFLSAVDPNDLDNYSGIAVGSVLGKVFSLLLHARLSA